jgi:hypothetical protein
MIGTGFGGLWAVMGAMGLPRSWTPWAVAAALVIALFLLGRLWFSASPDGTRLFRRSAYLIAVVLEVAALVACGYLLPRYGLQAYFVPAIGIIVGLHFIGLWRASAKPVFLWVAGAICAISVAAIVLPAEPEGVLNPRVIFASYGNAMVLWISAARRK